jgi:hypothetical protein
MTEVTQELEVTEVAQATEVAEVAQATEEQYPVRVFSLRFNGKLNQDNPITFNGEAINLEKAIILPCLQLYCGRLTPEYKGKPVEAKRWARLLFLPSNSTECGLSGKFVFELLLKTWSYSNALKYVEFLNIRDTQLGVAQVRVVPVVGKDASQMTFGSLSPDEKESEQIQTFSEKMGNMLIPPLQVGDQAQMYLISEYNKFGDIPREANKHYESLFAENNLEELVALHDKNMMDQRFHQFI